MHGWWAASYLVLWLLVITSCVVIVALARQIGTLHMRLGPRGALEIDDEGPPIGEAPPSMEVTDTNGNAAVIGGPGKAQVIMFVSPGCRICEEVLPGLVPVAQSHRLVPYVISESYGHETPSYPGAPGAQVIASSEAVRLYEIPGTPFAVVLDRSGIVRSKGTVNNLEQLEGLVDTAMRRGNVDPRQGVIT
jgi:methylamine dehydrogenase accessory protein MauD